MLKRKIVKRRMSVLIMLLVLCSGAVVTRADETHTLYYTRVKQQKSNWCWAASAENSVRWEQKVTRTQKDAVKKLKGTVINPYPNTMGAIGDIKKAAEYISCGKESYICTPLSPKYGRTSFDFLKKQAKRSNVTILVGGEYANGVRVNGHAVVCVGYEISDKGNELKIYDPFDGSTTNVLYSTFVKGWKGLIYEGTVYNAE